MQKYEDCVIGAKFWHVVQNFGVLVTGLLVMGHITIFGWSSYPPASNFFLRFEHTGPDAIAGQINVLCVFEAIFFWFNQLSPVFMNSAYTLQD